MAPRSCNECVRFLIYLDFRSGLLPLYFHSPSLVLFLHCTMTALGRSGLLQSGPSDRVQKQCSVQARPARASRLAARGPVQALAAPSRHRHMSPERQGLEHSMAPSHFVQGASTSADAVRAKPDGHRGISLHAATDAVRSRPHLT